MTQKLLKNVKALLERAVAASKIRRLIVARKSLGLRRYARRRLGLPGKPSGVNLVGYIRAEMGLGTVARGIASALDAASIPFNVINLEQGNTSRHDDLTWAHREVSSSPYDITVAAVNPDNSFNLKLHVSREILGRTYFIYVWFWELPELPDEWTSEFKFADEIWAGSRFIESAVSLKSPVPVVRVPPVVQVPDGGGLPRTHFGLSDQRFLFLGMFDTHSFLERKNPLAVVRAFKKAFPENTSDVGLILKFNNPDQRDPVTRAVMEEVRGRDDVSIINRNMTRQEVTSLISVSDCFVSLHRSEGFGLGPAEAMYLSKPIILTNWSGNTDYMTSENSIGIDYELVKLGQDYGPYRAHQHWAEPDVDQAAYWMKKLFTEPALAQRIGKRGQETIKTNCSPEAVGRLIQERLDQIRRNL